MTDFIATYRLQLGPGFGFAEALQVVPYLQRLGVSHLYLSPIWQARAKSRHGYDVVDPAKISLDLGGEDRFLELARAGLGIILDLVPNHMATDDDNPYWADLESRGKVFDVDEETGFRRRFFDVSDLAGVRVEDEAVFETTHRKVLELFGAGLVDGVRVDHIDGLADPASYLDRLLARGAHHIWVEKILEAGEELRQWPVEGTTGYEFLNDVTALFVDPAAESLLTELSRQLRPFADFAHEAKLEQAITVFGPEIEQLQHLYDVHGIALVLASLPVYRTYVVPGPHGRGPDAADLAALVELPEPVRTALTLQSPAPPEFIIRFQQTSGAVMAKGVEDTAFYRYVRLLALNEVGGDPARFGLSISAFHRANGRRAARFPRALLASQTHDTKRSGDVRARLVALSHLAPEWCRLVAEWHEMSMRWHGSAAPDWEEELFIYQTLVGAWPIEKERLSPYLEKALREAKRNSSWVEPNREWEEAVIAFTDQLCGDRVFRASLETFVTKLALIGEQISLAELVLRLTAPGVPDIYQGDETWNFSLVDPDNRREVDWELLAELAECGQGSRVTRSTAKVWVTARLLALRGRRAASFEGAYRPLTTAAGTCAYMRGDDVVVVVAVGLDAVATDPPQGRWSNVLADLDDAYSALGLAVYERIGEEA